MDLETWNFFLAILALIGPALLVGGIVVGRLIERVNGAHRRIDGFEDSVKDAWRYCPRIEEGKKVEG